MCGDAKQKIVLTSSFGYGFMTELGNLHSRVKAGTYFPITLKKHMRAQAIAERCGLNCVYIADSGGFMCGGRSSIEPTIDDWSA